MDAIPDDRSSIFAGMKPFTWDSDKAVAYEAALEAGHAAIGAYTARIAAEERRPDPDRAALRRWQSEQAACAQERDALDATDPAAVDAARRRFSDIAQRIRAQG